MKTSALLPSGLARFLKLWPGLIAVFSLMAVWGNQVGHPESPRTLMAAGPAALPDLRAMPAPTPGPGLLAAPEPEAGLTPPSLHLAAVSLGRPQRGAPAPDLAVLGRQQTDGG